MWHRIFSLHSLSQMTSNSCSSCQALKIWGSVTGLVLNMHASLPYHFLSLWRKCMTTICLRTGRTRFETIFSLPHSQTWKCCSGFGLSTCWNLTVCCEAPLPFLICSAENWVTEIYNHLPTREICHWCTKTLWTDYILPSGFINTNISCMSGRIKN